MTDPIAEGFEYDVGYNDGFEQGKLAERERIEKILTVSIKDWRLRKRLKSQIKEAKK